MSDEVSSDLSGDARGIGWILALAVAAFMAPYLIGFDSDPDLWGHTLFGATHIDTGVLAREDPYTYTNDGQPWVNHEWLAELAFGAAWKLAGQAGMIALRTFLFMGMVAALVRAMWERARAPVVIGVLTFWVLPYFDTFMILRPHAFTWFFMALVILWTEWIRGGRMIWAWAMAPLLTAWVNAHGGFIVGLCVVELCLGSLLIGFEDNPRPWTNRERAHLVGAMAAAALATLVNPYGFGIYVYLYDALSLVRPISEWQPITGGMRLHYGVMVTLVALGWLATRRRDRLAGWVLFAVGCYAGWKHARFFVLMAMCSVVVLNDVLAMLAARWTGRRPPWLGPTALVALALLSLVPTAGALRGSGFTVRVDPTVYPVLGTYALELRAEAIGPNLAVLFSWGEYAIWHLYPDYKVSMDGRYETVYPPGRTEAAIFAELNADVDTFLHHRPADAAMVRTGSALEQALRAAPEWSMWHEDATATIFLPAGHTVAPVTREELETIPRLGEFP